MVKYSRLLVEDPPAGFMVQGEIVLVSPDTLFKKNRFLILYPSKPCGIPPYNSE